ncbi:hypothetical protein [Butyrivibrio proteoclasticus]|uniref:hypothetical protein n=1 Tax=Butyrivibrio proteoclasticus TaxID=43305 RepID=UPI00047DF2CA|nr:hypothetical protein [Butyrivibrio proteoclasticus]
MSAEESIVKIYAEAEDKERINIILEHFDNFIMLIDLFEEDLRNTLKEEKLYNKRAERGDPGVRVQTSGTGDPTGNEATNNVQLARDLQSGNIEQVMRGADEDMEHRDDIETLKMMRSDYSDIIKAIETLKPKPRAELKDILNGVKDISKVAEDSNSGYDATKHRLTRSRGKVRKRAICLIRARRGIKIKTEE